MQSEIFVRLVVAAHASLRNGYEEVDDVLLRHLARMAIRAEAQFEVAKAEEENAAKEAAKELEEAAIRKEVEARMPDLTDREWGEWGGRGRDAQEVWLKVNNDRMLVTLDDLRSEGIQEEYVQRVLFPATLGQALDQVRAMRKEAAEEEARLAPQREANAQRKLAGKRHWEEKLGKK